MRRRRAEQPGRTGTAVRREARAADVGAKRRRIAPAVAAAAVLGVVLAYALTRGGSTQAVPPLPDLSGYPTAVAAHLAERHAAAAGAPASPAARGALCVAYHADMFYDEAEACYTALAAREPGEWQWIYLRALIRADRGGGEALAADLRQTVERAPDFAPAWLRLGDAEFKAGRRDAAREAWRRVLDLPEPQREPGDPPHLVETPVGAYASLGLARLALADGALENARGILETMTVLAPDFSSGFRLLAEVYTALGRAADAERALAHARRLPPYAPYADPLIDRLARESRNSTFLLRMASEANLAMNGAWSEYLTRRALEFDPDNPEVVSKLGRVLQTLGRSEEALPYFRRYHELVPGDFEGLAYLGSCLSDLGRFDEAEPLLRRALEGLDDALTHYHLGLLLSRTGRPAEAEQEYERALERDANHANARINLATLLVRRGALDRASLELERVLAQDPLNALAHANLGLVLAEQGRTERAIGSLQEALRLDPGLAQAAEALRVLGAPPG